MGGKRPKNRRKQREKEAKGRERRRRPSRPPKQRRRIVVIERELLGPDIKSAKYAALGEPTKTVALLERMGELFAPKVANGMMVLERPPTAETISKLADDILHMWPKGFVLPAPQPDSAAFRGLYWGRRVPSTLATAVTRASLYCDKIYVLNPFVDDMIYHPDHSPLVRPGEWIDIYSSNALYVALLSPWIRAGVVELVASPAMTNPPIREACFKQADKYRDRLGRRYDEIVAKYSTETLAETVFHLPDTALQRVLDHWQPSEGERAEILSAVRHFRELDPVLCNVPRVGKGQFIRSGTGASPPAIGMIAEMLGAVIITDTGLCATLLRSRDARATRNDVLSRAVGDLQMSFLNAVPPQFALGLRGDGRLADFRRFLNDVVALASDPVTPTEAQVAACATRLTEEYDKYKREMKTIQTQLASTAFVKIPILGAVGAVGAIVTGSLSVTAVASTLLVNQASALWDSIVKRRAHRAAPLGVIFDLEQAHSVAS